MARKKDKSGEAAQQQIENDGNATCTIEIEVWDAITDEQFNRDAQKFAKVSLEINSLLDEKRAAATEYTEKIKKLREEEKRLARIVESKTAPRKVKATEYADYAHGRMTVTRDDTGEVVEDRSLTADEMAGSEEAQKFTSALPPESDGVMEQGCEYCTELIDPDNAVTLERGDGDDAARFCSEKCMKAWSERRDKENAPKTLKGEMICTTCGAETTREGYYDPTQKYECITCGGWTVQDKEFLESTVADAAVNGQETPAQQ